MSVADPHLMLAFEGTEVPDWLEERLQTSPPAGVSLFREHNMESPEQVAELTTRLQELNSSPLPLLIAVDQEGGQLLGLTGCTPFAGNMALGATGDPLLTESVAEAMGAELAAVGINVDYAPVVDVASRPGNPSLGIRSFGEDPAAVAGLGAAFTRGMIRSGVMATAKHFPGKGEARVDPHYELPRLDLDLERLERVELPPFQAAFDAGAGLVMTGHYDVPALTERDHVPVSASEKSISGFIRGRLGFTGLVITDALDMGALEQGAAQVVDIITMMRAGTDLLLCMPDPDLQQRVRVAVERGADRELIPEATLGASRSRIERFRARVAASSPDPDRVGANRLADELAARSMTLVRNDAGLIPLRPDPGDRILCLEPESTNLTPADTTALYPQSLASALRAHHPRVTELVYPQRPDRGDVDGVVALAEDHDLVVVGTVAAGAEQAALVDSLIATGRPVVTIALRTPYDLAAYPAAATHLCTYSGHQPSTRAAADALFGKAGYPGRLPVAVPGLYPIGHGLTG